MTKKPYHIIKSPCIGGHSEQGLPGCVPHTTARSTVPTDLDVKVAPWRCGTQTAQREGFLKHSLKTSKIDGVWSTCYLSFQELGKS